MCELRNDIEELVEVTNRLISMHGNTIDRLKSIEYDIRQIQDRLDRIESFLVLDT